jgi:hypothetical protein
LNLFSAKQTDVATAASSNLKSKFLKLTGIGETPAATPGGQSAGGGNHLLMTFSQLLTNKNSSASPRSTDNLFKQSFSDVAEMRLLMPRRCFADGSFVVTAKLSVFLQR